MTQRALYAEFIVLPGSEERVADMLRELTAHVRQEPGNIAFVPYSLESDPRHIFVYEVYRDEAAFQEHISAPYGAVFNSELGRHIEGDGSELTWLKQLD